MADKSNKQMITELFELMTVGFYISGELVDPKNEKQESQTLQLTKQWRQDLWRKAHEIEARMCPRPSSAPPPDYRAMMIKKSNAKKTNAPGIQPR